MAVGKKLINKDVELMGCGDKITAHRNVLELSW